MGLSVDIENNADADKMKDLIKKGELFLKAAVVMPIRCLESCCQDVTCQMLDCDLLQRQGYISSTLVSPNNPYVVHC